MIPQAVPRGSNDIGFLEVAGATALAATLHVLLPVVVGIWALSEPELDLEPLISLELGHDVPLGDLPPDPFASALPQQEDLPPAHQPPAPEAPPPVTPPPATEPPPVVEPVPEVPPPRPELAPPPPPVTPQAPLPEPERVEVVVEPIPEPPPATEPLPEPEPEALIEPEPEPPPAPPEIPETPQLRPEITPPPAPAELRPVEPPSLEQVFVPGLEPPPPPPPLASASQAVAAPDLAPPPPPMPAPAPRPTPSTVTPPPAPAAEAPPPAAVSPPVVAPRPVEAPPPSVEPLPASEAVVASAPPALAAPPAAPRRPETAAARAAREAGVPEAYYVRLRGQISSIAARSYPRRSLDLGEEGTVVMLIRLREDGSVIDIEIQEARTDASPRLQRAAQRAVLRAAPFEPLPEGAGVKSILLPVVYRIAER